MPSTFRSSRSGRQLDGNRRTGQIDHDVFEGLPVRRWSRQPHTHSQVPKTEDSEFTVQGPGGTSALPELAMPRDSQLLSASSRALLRAARAGCIYIHQNARAPDEDDKTLAEGEEGAGGTHSADRTFTSRKWMTLPKHLEPAEVEFLAKRRSGLPSLYGGTTSIDGSGSGPGPMRRTKFKKTDPETGKISIYEAWVPEGHRIEGEITGDVQAIVQQSAVPVNSEMPAPGTVVEGVGIVNSEGVVVAEAGSASVMTPPKRRPPPPKRKGKGIGKGRKKKVMFAPGEGADASTVHGVPAGANGHGGAPKEGQDLSQMSIDQSGQEDDEEDGDDGDDSDEGDESMMDAKTPETPQAPSVTESGDQPTVDTSADSKDVEMPDATFEPEPHASEPSVTAQEAESQLSAAPEAPQAEPQATVAVSDAPASTTEKSESASTEQVSGLDVQPTDAGSLETPAAPYKAEAPSHLASETVPKEESVAPEPTPAAGAHATLHSIPAEPAPESIQVALEIPVTGLKEEPQPPIEDVSTSTSIDKPSIDKLVEGIPSELSNEPERKPSEQHIEAPIPLPAEVQNNEPAPALNEMENKQDFPSGPDSRLDSAEREEDVKTGEAPSEPQQPTQPEEPMATEAVKPASPSPQVTQAPIDEAPQPSPLEPVAANLTTEEEVPGTEVQAEKPTEILPPVPTEEAVQQVAEPTPNPASVPPALAPEENKDEIEPQPAPAPESA